MRIISKKKLREFWTEHPDSRSPLSSWHKVVEGAEWSGPNDVRETYRSADVIGSELAVFNICNNDYRLIASIDYQRGIVYIYGVYTHRDYDRLNLKGD